MMKAWRAFSLSTKANTRKSFLCGAGCATSLAPCLIRPPMLAGSRQVVVTRCGEDAHWSTVPAEVAGAVGEACPCAVCDVRAWVLPLERPAMTGWPHFPVHTCSCSTLL